MPLNAALVYAKFSPFHLARLESSGSLGLESGNTLYGIEIAGFESDYNWQFNPPAGNRFVHHTLFPEEDFHQIGYRRLRSCLWQCLDRINPDVIVLPGWTSPGRAGLAWALARGVPRVLMSDSHKIGGRQPLIRTRIKRLLAQRFQSAFAAGAPQVRWLEELGVPFAKCVTGCDVVDNTFFHTAADHGAICSPTGNAAPVLLSCLRLIPLKNAGRILECLASHSPQWHWRIAGDGPERAAIDQRIDELGLTNRIELVGRVQYGELPAFYQSGDVYIQPSTSETWGLAVNEAMASGLPVLVSDRCGCHEDLVRGGINGFIFDPLDQNSTAAALQQMWEKRAAWNTMGEASQAIIADWDLGRFASGFWKACEIAVGAGEELHSSVADRLVSACL
jgi:glycosyltransferase involved in cell wall biosynthesis